MKVRNGFVSNSSSSSFIVQIDDANLLECPNCKKILESLFTIAPAREIVVEEYGYNSWEDYLAEYDEAGGWKPTIYDAVKEDKTIMYANVEYGEEDIYYKVLDSMNLEYVDEG